MNFIVGNVYLRPYVKVKIIKRNRLINYNIPVIDYKHNDVENGQFIPHYHADTRFLKNIPIEYALLRPEGDIENEGYFECYHLELNSRTSLNNIGNSKLKYKCIHKGKCPHRGYDLSNEIPNKNGIIICPLHSLKFDKNGKLLE